MNHERCRIQPNQFIAHYGQKLGALAINTARVIKHEISPPQPERLPINRSELQIIDDERAIIKESSNG